MSSPFVLLPFLQRQMFPWRQPPHPLLQQTLDMEERGIKHTAVFHATLMRLFKDHTIEGRTLFPGAGFVEMALAAAERLEGLPGVVLLSAGTDGTDGCVGSTALIPPALTTLILPDSAPCLAQRFDAHARPTPAAGAVADGECAACVHCPLGSARCHANRSARAKPWDHG